MGCEHSRTVDVAWTMNVAFEAKVDYITFDGAGGGTGMSPVPMMNEMCTPTVYLVYTYLSERLGLGLQQLLAGARKTYAISGRAVTADRTPPVIWPSDCPTFS